MKTRRYSLIFTNAVVGIAVLLAFYTGNPWASLVAAGLFLFVIFPRWRSKLYRLIDKAIERFIGNDSCDPRA